MTTSPVPVHAGKTLKAGTCQVESCGRPISHPANWPIFLSIPSGVPTAKRLLQSLGDWASRKHSSCYLLEPDCVGLCEGCAPLHTRCVLRIYTE